MGWLLAAAFFFFIFWGIKRAREKAAEMAATGELRSPLYWIGVTLTMGVLVLSMIMASMKPSTISSVWWFLAFVLFFAALLVRRALRWRYPH
jgi:hypothetical protein